MADSIPDFLREIPCCGFKSTMGVRMSLREIIDLSSLYMLSSMKMRFLLESEKSILRVVMDVVF